MDIGGAIGWRARAPFTVSHWWLVWCCTDVTSVVTIWAVARYRWVKPLSTRQFWLLKWVLIFCSFLRTIQSSEWASSLMRWTYGLFLHLITAVLIQVLVLIRGDRRHQLCLDMPPSVPPSWWGLFRFSSWVGRSHRSCVPCGYDKGIQRERSIRTLQRWKRSTGHSESEVYWPYRHQADASNSGGCAVAPLTSSMCGGSMHAAYWERISI